MGEKSVEGKGDRSVFTVVYCRVLWVTGRIFAGARTPRNKFPRFTSMTSMAERTKGVKLLRNDDGFKDRIQIQSGRFDPHRINCK